jgi:hypothetical protein
MNRRIAALLAVGCLCVAGCGSGAKTISRHTAEQDAAEARDALEQIEPMCSKGQVLIKLSRTRSSCVEPKHAASEVGSHFKCPSGFHMRVDLTAHDVECSSVVTLDTRSSP